MKWRNSISFRLSLTLLGLTIGCLVGISIGISTALENFFIQDTQGSLKRQAKAMADRAGKGWSHSEDLSDWTNLIAQQGQVQVFIYSAAGTVRMQALGVPDSTAVQLPQDLISKTLKGIPQQGRFWIPAYPKYPWWLYSTEPVRQAAVRHGGSATAIGAVYIAVPLKRPKQFAQKVNGLVMGIAIMAVSGAAIAGVFLSRSVIYPLQRLQQQAQKLKSGDYSARSTLQGTDELAQLGYLLNEMAAKLALTLENLKFQEISRRELMANVSHDFRTPLASLRLNLDAVLDGVVRGDKARQFLQRGCREIDYLSRLVDQLLMLSRADAGQLQVQPQAVSAVAIAQECLSRMALIADQAGMKLRLTSVPDLPKVWVDPQLTGQAILNVLDNAMKYGSGGELIRLQVLPVSERDERKYVPILVQDWGKGMEQDTLRRSTERSYRGREESPEEGLGLGLAIAKQVCQLQGGRLYLHSEPNQGTIVILLLPVFQEAMQH
jgi:signal transduction histidine kinase